MKNRQYCTEIEIKTGSGFSCFARLPGGWIFMTALTMPYALAYHRKLRDTPDHVWSLFGLGVIRVEPAE